MSTTQQYCEECGTTENLQEILGHHYCTTCLLTGLGGSTQTKEARQLRLDPKIFDTEADSTEPTTADRFREALDFQQSRDDARCNVLREYANFRQAHPWVKPGMVVVAIATGDLAVVRSSTNPDIQWHLLYLTTVSALDDPTISHVITPSTPKSARLRIGDSEEYDEARELLTEWPARARDDIYIGQPDPDLFNEQFAALLTTLEVN